MGIFVDGVPQYSLSLSRFKHGYVGGFLSCVCTRTQTQWDYSFGATGILWTLNPIVCCHFAALLVFLPCLRSIWNHYLLLISALKSLRYLQHQLLDKVLSFLPYSKQSVVVEVFVPEWGTFSLVFHEMPSIYLVCNVTTKLEGLSAFLLTVHFKVGKTVSFEKSLEQLDKEENFIKWSAGQWRWASENITVQRKLFAAFCLPALCQWKLT